MFSVMIMRYFLYPGNCDDPEIEEHFRRSLGTKYQSYMTSCSLPRNGEIPDTVASSASNISITGMWIFLLLDLNSFFKVHVCSF